MVLRTLPLMLAVACLHKAPPQRLADAAPISAALIVDHADGVSALPEEVNQRVVRELEARNLDVRPVDGGAFGSARNTQQRLALLARSGDAPYVLLLETRVVYYDVLQGRFRWVVYGRATVARRDDLVSAASSEFEIPVFLLYEHEKEPEALKAAAGGLADRTAALLDNFLGGPVKSGALYFILLDRFAGLGGGPEEFHGGNLKAVLQHLDDLQSLGVRDVWISPIFKMRTEKFFGYGAYHGYWTEDLTRVEPRFGTLDDVKQLAAALHARGMRLYLDLVLNHVAPESPLTREHPDWFHHEGSITDWNDPSQMETHDVSGLPDLAQENPAVYDYLFHASLKWAELADGFREDAVKHVSLAFWSRFNRALKERKPSLQLLGEALDGDPARLARIEHDGAFDSLFDFPVGFALTDVFCKGTPAAHLGAVLSLDRLYDDASSLVTLLDDHDLPRISSACNQQQVRQALLVQMALRGTPMISYGTESALRESRGDMRWDDQPLRPWIAQLLRLRREHPALDHGAEQILSLDPLLIARVAPEEAIVLAVHGSAPGTQLISAGDCALYLAKVELPKAAPREIVMQLPQGALVVGAGPELGSWDPAHALSGEPHLTLPSNTIAEFKLLRKRADGTVEWEHGENRYLFVERSQRLVLEWRS